MNVVWEWPWLDVMYYARMVEDQKELDAISSARWSSLAMWDAKAFKREVEKVLGTEDTRTSAEIIHDTIASDEERRHGRS